MIASQKVARTRLLFPSLSCPETALFLTAAEQLLSLRAQQLPVKADVVVYRCSAAPEQQPELFCVGRSMAKSASEADKTLNVLDQRRVLTLLRSMYVGTKFCVSTVRARLAPATRTVAS